MFKQEYPEFADIQEQIRRARAERSVAIGTMIGEAVGAVIQALTRPAKARGGKPLVVRAHLASFTRG